MYYTKSDVVRFVEESNRIEGINGVREDELVEFGRFMSLPKLTVDDMKAFVSVYQPDAVIRDRKGLDVMVGGYVPPYGGSDIVPILEEILTRANCADDPWRVHVAYESLHPFTDCNGRSGRMVWYWMMRSRPKIRLGFLHAFYYQTLDKCGERANIKTTDN